jgi:hypothetical protein
MRSLRLFLPALILAAVAFVGCSSPTSSSSPAAVVVVTPTVTAVVPASGATAVAINNALSATFSVAIDPTTLTTSTFTLTTGTPAVTVVGVVTKPSTTSATFTPTGNLAASTLYTATLTTGVKSAAGVALAAAKVWTFTTGTSVSGVASVLPANTATAIAVNTTVSANFSAAMNQSTLSSTTFTLVQGSTPVAGTVTSTSTGVTFTPSALLAVNTTYTATLSTGVQNALGTALATAYTWSFATVTASPAGPLAVNLGTAANFAILAKTAISTVNATVITGNIGVSPAAASFITGFSLVADSTNVFSTSTYIVGQAFASDYSPPTPANLTTAVSDMQAAYVDAAGRTTPTSIDQAGGLLGGLTLAPGLYKFTTNVSIDTALTLNGAVNDVIIFQIAGKLTLSNGINIVLTGGIQAKNIFWQVAQNAVLGTTSVFKGNILSMTQIAANNGATVTGRLLSQTAVSLDDVTLTTP